MRNPLLLILSLAALLQASLVPVLAIDPSLCADDGVTEVPWFATRDPSTQCLMIDPGNGDPEVPFQYEDFHKRGIAGSTSSTPPEFRLSLNAYMNDFGGCRSVEETGQYCTVLMWNVTIDNYLHQDAKNRDLMTYARPVEYIYMKDSNFLNSWKCDGDSNAWSGPNGIYCLEGENTDAHTDGLQ